MKENDMKIKVFFLKSRPNSNNDSQISANTQNKLSSFQNLYLAKNRTRSKDVTHLSTLLQREKTEDCEQIQNNKDLDDPQIFSSKFIGSVENKNMFFETSSNKKQNQQPVQVNKELEKQFTISKVSNPFLILTQAAQRRYKSSEQKFYTIAFQRKQFKSNNLASIFKQKWSHIEMKKDEQKISRMLKSTVNFKCDSKEAIEQKRFPKSKMFMNKTYSVNLNKKNDMEEDFMNFIEKKKGSRLQEKIEITRSQRAMIEGQTIYQPKEKDLKSSRNRVKSLSEKKTPKKINFLSSNIKTIFVSQIENKNSCCEKYEKDKNKSNLKYKKFSNNTINRKKKSMFLPRENDDRLWWSKQHVVQKTGLNFDLTKALVS